MPRKPKTGGAMSYGQLVAALMKQHPKTEYAVLSEVRNGTGFGHAPRTADLLALSLWPSRGLYLHGFEIKQYRGDWMRELHEPAKAEAIAQFCDYWWLAVTNADIVALDEVPPTWGVWAPDEKGEKVVVLKPAERMSAKEFDRAFVAAILRKASEGSVPQAAVTQQIEAARQLGYEQGERTATDANELKRLRIVGEVVKDFEHATGLSFQEIATWNKHTAQQIGKAVRLVLDGGDELQRRVDHLRYVTKPIENLLKTVKTWIKNIEDVTHTLKEPPLLEEDGAEVALS